VGNPKKKALQKTPQAQMNKTQDVEKYYLRATPGSIDEERRTVDVVFTTGYRGLRPSFFGDDYYEELEVSEKAMRMDRLRSGGVALFGHDSYSLDNLVGTVEGAAIDDGSHAAMAKIRFGTDETAEKVFQKVKEGILKNVSVGYMVYKYEEQEETVDGLRVYRATDWEPVEISFVSVPFDPYAQVRSRKILQERTKCTIVTREGEEMGKKLVQKRDEEVPETGAVASEEVTEKDTPAAPEASQASVAAETPAAPEASAEETPPADGTASVSSILRSCEKANLSVKETRAIVEDFNSKKLTLAQAHERVVDEWTKKERKVAGPMDIEAGSYDKMSVLVDGVSNALLHRMRPDKNKLDDKGAKFRGRSLVEMGRDYLEMVGINARNMTRSEIASKLLSRNTQIHVRTGFQGTSDFPEILANVANKVLLEAYDRFPQTFRPWTRRSTSPDFKQMSRLRLGEGPALEKVTEHGEYKYGSFGEAKEVYSLATYGKIIPFTRQAIINDDLSAFDRVTEALGLNAAALESDIVYAILTANAALSDAVALFHATHGNLGTDGTIDSTTLTEMRKLGRQQVGIDNQKLNIVYSFLIVPSGMETVAQQAIAQIVPDQTTNVNVFRGLYRVIAEPRLDDESETEWYAAAEPGRVDTIEYCYLEGNESVSIDQEVEFDTDGLKIKARHDFAAKALDHRGLFKNPYSG
jgi:HK97 family phage prohead protease